MSYLNALRLHFAGQFQANPSTVNNDPGHFDNATFQPSYQKLQGPNFDPPNGWFNPAVFSEAPQGSWGTAGPGDVEGPGMQIYNLSVTKFFKIRADGRVNLRVRADFLNAFNA